MISRRQTKQHLSGYWEFPGGKLRAEETGLEALQRELMEEVGILPIELKPLMQVRHQYTDRDILLDVWTVSSFQGNPCGCEGQEICWVGVNELDGFQFPEANNAILKAIKNSVLT